MYGLPTRPKPGSGSSSSSDDDEGNIDTDAAHRTVETEYGNYRCRDCEKMATSPAALNKTECKPLSDDGR